MRGQKFFELYEYYKFCGKKVHEFGIVGQVIVKGYFGMRCGMNTNQKIYLNIILKKPLNIGWLMILAYLHRDKI